ncbi:transposase, partial [Streptomyces flaveolus]|uniref:transposase n=1 Tax=Streptomyces flaveolus TaxID=67297 RepID=UPI0036FFEA31
MRAWVAEQGWFTLERLPAWAPELNPVELLWSSLKKRELANLADVADATEQGIHRINANSRLPWSFLAHTGLSIRPPHPPNVRKDQYFDVLPGLKSRGSGLGRLTLPGASCFTALCGHGCPSYRRSTGVSCL